MAIQELEALAMPEVECVPDLSERLKGLPTDGAAYNRVS